MKHLLLSLMALFITLTSHNLFAAEQTATITEASCIEVDPFLVGDVCIVLYEIPTNGKITKIGVLYDTILEANNGESIDGLAGSKALVDVSKWSKIYDRDVINELQQLDKDYFYMSSDETELNIIDETVDPKVLICTSAQKIAGWDGGETYGTLKLTAYYDEAKFLSRAQISGPFFGDGEILGITSKSSYQKDYVKYQPLEDAWHWFTPILPVNMPNKKFLGYVLILDESGDSELVTMNCFLKK